MPFRLLVTLGLLCALLPLHHGAPGPEGTAPDPAHYRERVKAMFYHAYDSYLENAFPYDELRPLTCDGHDTWGSFSLTLIDALDTLLILGNVSEFQRVVEVLQDNVDFDIDVNASVFETNIRVVGGLLSAHLLSKKAGVEVEAGWPCSGPLLRMAEEAARKLLPAFQTPTGMPYGTVNLLHGVNPGETPVTCTAGIGTFIVEFATLSSLTGDPVFEDVARVALTRLWESRSDIGLVGNHIDVLTGKWVAQDSGIGAGVDSYFEYLVKGAILLQDKKLMAMFLEYNKAIRNYTRFDDWYLWVQMYKGTVSMPVFQSLEAYWPGLQSLIGDIDNAMRTFLNYYTVWKQFGGLPEFYNIPQGYTVEKREGYPLRPELIESAMYLYRATGDPTLLELGRDAVESIEKISKVECGFATVSVSTGPRVEKCLPLLLKSLWNVSTEGTFEMYTCLYFTRIKDLRDHKLDNRMESFFLAETVKYLYLLFDPANFIHNNGSTFDAVITPYGECILGAGGYIFNTEAHPIDPAALHCCRRLKEEQWEVEDLMREFYSLKRKRSRFQKKTMSSGPWQPPTGPGSLSSPENQDQVREKKPAKQKIPLLSCPSQPFTSKLALLGQVFLDSS
ncbi:ER degradation-enhancing alpha-mannosidase-like protein 2 isoform X1 [Ailuropoda melanoleuca]|uniref:ER degradation-enhancing alpha-mannosidase-like protein 2 isoform X1 n=2 Tax=Ailuropoda melanoleuca TaxID=9646 RepID=UPI001494AFE3|nr:ER degradation-enhancing alpha-mannosidase-like protein 2 isoform X1 [Ailuropoda melanoleuca]